MLLFVVEFVIVLQKENLKIDERGPKKTKKLKKIILYLDTKSPILL